MLLENKTLILNPQANKASIIWLHGLGASPEDFSSFEKSFPEYTFILPHAPTRPIDLWGQTLPAWFNISTTHRQDDHTISGILDTHEMLEDIVSTLSKPYFIGGFSQGAAQALFSGHRFQQPPLGIIAISGYRPKHDFVEQESPPTLIMHGQNDEVITAQFADMSYTELYETPNCEAYLLPCGHCWHEDMTELMSTFINKWQTK